MIDRLVRWLNRVIPPLNGAMLDNPDPPPGPRPDAVDFAWNKPEPTIVVVPIIVYAGPPPATNEQRPPAE
jgi:hypothetical protein